MFLVKERRRPAGLAVGRWKPERDAPATDWGRMPQLRVFQQPVKGITGACERTIEAMLRS